MFLHVHCMPVNTLTTNVKEGSDNMKGTSFNYIICKNFSVCLELPTYTTYIHVLCIGGSRLKTIVVTDSNPY